MLQFLCYRVRNLSVFGHLRFTSDKTEICTINPERVIHMSHQREISVLGVFYLQIMSSIFAKKVSRSYFVGWHSKYQI